MQHKSRPHIRRLKLPKISSYRVSYISEDDDRCNPKKIFDMFESEFYVSKAIRRATRWFKSHKTIPIHNTPMHIKEKLSLLEYKLKNA